MDTPKHLMPYEWMKKEWLTGIQEIPGKENNPRIVWYHSFTTLRATDDETPWCSAVMCAAAESCGFKSTRSAAAISWETYGEDVPVYDIQEGDIMIFKRGKDLNSRARHVTFYKQSISVGSVLKYECLGGNQGNKIGLSRYNPKDLVSVRRFKG